MPNYYYRAKDKRGYLVKGSIEAPSTWMAKKLLTKSELTVVELNQFSLKNFFESLNSKVEQMTGSVSPEEVIVLMGQLETGFSVGIPIIQMLQMLQNDAQNKYLKDTLKTITADITEGSSLYSAFSKHPKIFSPITLGLIKTGEATGKLEEALKRVNQMVEQQTENREKVKAAIFYPKMVLSIMGIVVMIIIYYVIPKLKAFLSNMGADLPAITQLVVGISDFFIGYWFLILPFFMGTYYIVLRYISTPAGKRQFDHFKLKAPLFGIIFSYFELNNFCFVLELLISSGIPLIEALENLKESQQNVMFQEAISKCQTEIAKGGTLVKGMDHSDVFPNSLKNMLAIGEETGRMQPILIKLGKYYQIQVDYKLDNLSKLIEPILLMFIAVMVLVLALAVFLPIWKINSSIKGK